jgi:hypothetical protein
VLKGINFIAQPQQLPTLQRERDIAILPDEVVHCAKTELVFLQAPSFGNQPHDLQLAYLVADGLPG